MKKFKAWFWDIVLQIYVFVLRTLRKFPRQSELEKFQKERDQENEPWVKARIKVEAELAKCFKESLMTGLPHHLRGLNTYLENFPRVDDELRKYIYREDEEEIKLAGSPYSEMLIRYGLKISDFLHGIYGVEMRLVRALLRELIKEDDLVIDPQSKNFTHPVLQEGMAKEIEMMMHLDSQGTGKYGEIILSWIIEVLQNKPFLFERFRAVYEKDRIRLIFDKEVKSPISIEELNTRWKVIVCPETELDLGIGEDSPDA